MTVAQAAVLGAVQGASEFLPVSSHGHLLFAQRLLGLQEETLFDIVVHGGTLVSLLWFFGKDLLRLSRRWLVDLAIATAVTAVLALPLKHLFETTFSGMFWVAIGFLVTGCILFATRYLPLGNRTDVGVAAAVAVGFAQFLGVAPSLSRSGLTLAFGLFCGVSRAQAGRFAFLLAIPAVGGALVLEAPRMTAALQNGRDAAALLVGAAVACVVGVLALRSALHLVSAGHLHRFAYYLWPLGAATLGWSIYSG